MTQQPLALGRLSSGGVIATYRCTATCKHCLYNSSPRREPDYLSRERAQALFARLRALGCRSLHIGGGEPLLNVDLLCALIEEMRAAGIEPDYLETNGYWARGDARDELILIKLRDAGLTTLMLSLCPYHAEFVPLARVRYALRAAREVGLDTFVWQEQFESEVEALGDVARVHSLDEYEARFPGGTDALPRRFGLRLLGRAAVTHAGGGIATETLLGRAAPCRGPLECGHFHADVHGDFIPPGCTGLAIALEDAHHIEETRHPAVTLLVREGPAALVSRAREAGFVPRERYGSLCALCQHARTFLALRCREQWPDLRPHGFYEELRGTLLPPQSGHGQSVQSGQPGQSGQTGESKQSGQSGHPTKPGPR